VLTTMVSILRSSASGLMVRRMSQGQWFSRAMRVIRVLSRALLETGLSRSQRAGATLVSRAFCLRSEGGTPSTRAWEVVVSRASRSAASGRACARAVGLHSALSEGVCNLQADRTNGWEQPSDQSHRHR